MSTVPVTPEIHRRLTVDLFNQKRFPHGESGPLHLYRSLLAQHRQNQPHHEAHDDQQHNPDHKAPARVHLLKTAHFTLNFEL